MFILSEFEMPNSKKIILFYLPFRISVCRRESMKTCAAETNVCYVMQRFNNLSYAVVISATSVTRKVKRFDGI